MKSNMEPFMIRDLPLEERPRERLLLEGGRLFIKCRVIGYHITNGD